MGTICSRFFPLALRRGPYALSHTSFSDFQIQNPAFQILKNLRCLLQRQSDLKGRAALGRVAGGYGALMVLDDTVTDRQPDAHSHLFFAGEKRIENIVDVFF